MSEYFTEKEIKEFIEGSITFPYMTVEKEQNQVVEVSEIVSISGMATNNGIPTAIGVQVHRKGTPIQHLKYALENK